MTHDRTGDTVDPEQRAPTAIPPHTCDRGWRNQDTRRPCPHCRPWLTERPARPPTRNELQRLTERHT
ncbi:MAG: hypothetical protein ACRCZP_18955 [Phycicoccus sp.]